MSTFHSINVSESLPMFDGSFVTCNMRVRLSFELPSDSDGAIHVIENRNLRKKFLCTVGRFCLRSASAQRLLNRAGSKIQDASEGHTGFLMVAMWPPLQSLSRRSQFFRFAAQADSGSCISTRQRSFKMHQTTME